MNTRSPSPARGLWPTIEEEWLLKTVLFEGDEAVAAWHLWSPGRNLDELDRGSVRLLPLLHRRLAACGLESPWPERLRGEYTSAWRANQLRLHYLQRALADLQSHGIQVMVLKGVALALTYYADVGDRPMADCDVLVRYPAVPRALELLAAAGCRPHGIARHAQSLTHPFGWDIDLHWNVFPDLANRVADDSLWDAAVPIDLKGLTVSALCPTDQLLHVCVHGAAWAETPTFRWVVDAAMILRSGQTIDWPRLIGQAQRYGVVLRLLLTQEYLARVFHLPVPESALTELRSIAIPATERAHFEKLLVPHASRGLLNEVSRVWQDFGVWVRARGLRPSLRSFVHYLTLGARADSAWQVPRYGLEWIKRRDWRRLFTRGRSA